MNKFDEFYFEYFLNLNLTIKKSIKKGEMINMNFSPAQIQDEDQDIV